jgi:hypothetical protein
VFAEVGDFDFDPWREAGTGSAAEIAAGDDLIAALQEAYTDDDQGFVALKLE